MSREPKPRIHYFDIKVDRQGPVPEYAPHLGPCWVWTGCINPVTGYATFFDGKVMTGHRWSYQHYVGPIPPGLTIDHLCRVRACVNPLHLEPVSQGENTRRALAHAVATRVTCGNGHEWTEATTIWRKDRPGTRECRTCCNTARRRRRAELKLQRGAR